MMSDENSGRITAGPLLDQTARIVGAYAASVTLSTEELISMIRAVSSALVRAANVEPDAKELVPAVPVRRSVTPDFLICLEDGKKLKMLRGHLRHAYAMTPAEYRRKWSLPWDYPMVAPNYAALRSQIAKGFGFGRASRGRAAKLAA
jgi:predicted transcriptional regulator